MTVKELINFLKEYPDDMEVEITWEGIFRDIVADDIYVLDGKLVIEADLRPTIYD